MADDMMTLRNLLEESSDSGLLREMIGFSPQRLMVLEVQGLTGAEQGERSPERTNQRNGLRDRPWETRAGAVHMKVPKLRKGSCFPTRPPPGSRPTSTSPWRGKRPRTEAGSGHQRIREAAPTVGRRQAAQ